MKTRRPRLSVGAAKCRGQSSFSRRDDLPLGTPTGLIALLVLAGLVTGAWSQAAATPAFQPTFEAAACPEILAQVEGSRTSCGYLTVLENRAAPNGRTIRLFVLIGEPLEGKPPPDPMFSPGRDLALTRPPLARPCLGAFIGRACILMDQRGTGFSQPNLSCPEIEELTDPSFGVTLGTTEMDAALLDAVQACHDRLTAQGIDLSAYNLAEMAADAEDLRVTLGIDEWNLMTWGTSSAISFEIMRRYPDHVRAAAFDSPSPPQVDRFTEAVVGT